MNILKVSNGNNVRVYSGQLFPHECCVVLDRLGEFTVVTRVS